ncbi:MAG: hypothetical protein CVU69_08440 [Deltaproteobacteria bacterium HGW-Deltaproteobacteria-4]|nr:MAG: hypothetical protein CVU69_08440 [Deltaproteobacteria bacterium HGW-Deltaproteobacteria-4]
MRLYKRSFTNYFIDKRFQFKYVLLTILLLGTYTFILTIILFLPSIITLLFDYSLAEKAEAARTFLVLHGTVWPTTGAAILVFSILSIFLTHKIAGPVYRLKHALTELINGNLDIRIRLRKWDDLQELAEQFNFFSDDLRSYVISLKKDHERLSSYVDQLEQEIYKKDLSTEARQDIIEKLQEQKNAIAVTMERFTSKS